MLKKLTDAQAARLPAIRDYWLAVGLSTERAQRSEAEAGVRLAYQRVGLEGPAIFVWLDSPMAGALASACLLALSSPRAKGTVGAQVWAQVGARVGDRKSVV